MTSPQSSSDKVLRIIDASYNRIAEGLRFLEEIARFVLDAAVLTGRLKTMRHDLLRSSPSFQRRLLESRDVAGDVGADLEAAGEVKNRELPVALVAGARRAQESLRTLEELAKLPESPPEMESGRFQQARFELYTIEQELMARLTRQEKRRQIGGLYAIIDTQFLKGRRHIDVTGQVIRGGARVVQLRDKVQGRRELIPLARQMQALCAENGVLFIMNDYLDVALAADADGLHVGQDDIPVPEARKLLPPGKLVGCSATTVEQAVAARDAGADYIAVGAIYPTSSKITATTPAEVVGLKRLRQVRKAVGLPLVAIGGINQDNVADVVAAGADSAAVISALLAADSPETAARQIIDKMEERQ